MELLERADDLQTLGVALGHPGAVVVVEGPAGAGKSSLLAAAGARAPGVLAARAVEVERLVPWGLARQLFDSRRLNGLLEGERLHVLQGLLAHAEEALDGVTAVAVDDAHWLDDASAQLLAAFGARAERLGIAVLIGLRPEETGPAVETLAGLRAIATVVRPAPLSFAGVGSLVRAALPDAADELCDACAEVTGGNPFLAHELVGSLEDEELGAAPDARRVRELVPDSVRRSVLVRLGRLAAPARALAAAVAVLGEAPLRDAARLAELEPEAAEAAADALSAAQVLAPGDPLRFVHPLVAAAIAGDLSPFARARAHRRAADLLAAEDAPPERIATHLLQARSERDAGTVAVLRTAGERALGRGDAPAAVAFLARALDEPPEPEALGPLLVDLARAEAMAGDPGAIARTEAGLEHERDPQLRAAALHRLSRLLYASSDLAGAFLTAARGLEEVPADDPMAECLFADQILAASVDLERSGWAREHLARLAADARAGTLPTATGLLAPLALYLVASGEAAGDLLPRIGERAVDAGLLEDDDHGVAFAYLAAAFVFGGELDRAVALFGDAIAAAEARGATLQAMGARMWLAEAHLKQGDLDGAGVAAEWVLDVQRLGWTLYLGQATAVLAHVAIERGDLAAARAVVALGESAPNAQPIFLFARARLAERQGRVADALADLGMAGQILDLFGTRNPAVLPWRSATALVLARGGDPGRAAEARRLAGEEVALARASEASGPLGAALRAAGLVAGGEEGIARLEEAVAVLEGSPARLELARALADLGGALRRARRGREAQEPLRRALELAEERRALALCDQVRADLAAAGARPRRAARSGAASLTPTEDRVARLAARGLSNPDIAAELYVTPKTIEWHLGHVYGKLSIRGRRELATALAS